MKNKNLPLDYNTFIASQLSNKKEAAVFLQVALEEYENDGDFSAFLMAVRQIVDAQGGIGHLANSTKLNRENLYRTLSGKTNPKLNTLGLILNSLGFKLQIVPCSSVQG